MKSRTNDYRSLFASVWLIAAALWFVPLAAQALIMTGRGNDPVHDAGWPEGALAVANLKSRVGWWEGPPFGGGQWQFLYRGDTTVFNQAVAALAAIRAPVVELVLHDGPHENTFLKDKDKPESNARVDWTFTVWVPANWHHLFNNPKSVWDADHPSFRQPVDPPRMDVYLGGGGQVDWSKVTMPPGLKVRDERASSAGVNPIGGALIRVDAYDMANGKPVPGARVIAAAPPRGGGNSRSAYETVAEAVTDASGRAQVDKLPPNTYRVSVSAPGYAARMLGYEQLGEQGFKAIQTEMSKAGSLGGTVTDLEGRPLSGIKVRASSTMGINGRGYNAPETPEVVTDEAGHFEMAGLPSGYTQLRAQAPGVYHGDIFTIYDVPTTNVVLRVSRAGRVQIRVVAQDGQPMSRFEGSPLMVSMEPRDGTKVGRWGGSATVRDDGTFEFTDVPAGDYRIASHPNPSTTSKKYAEEQIVNLPPGGSVKVEIKYFGK